VDGGGVVRPHPSSPHVVAVEILLLHRAYRCLLAASFLLRAHLENDLGGLSGTALLHLQFRRWRRFPNFLHLAYFGSVPR
jgi:hypothetical protein